MIRYVVLDTSGDGPARTVACVDAEDWVGDLPETPPRVVLEAVWACWPGAEVVQGWVEWLVRVEGGTVGCVDYGPAPVKPDPRQVGMFG